MQRPLPWLALLICLFGLVRAGAAAEAEVEGAPASTESTAISKQDSSVGGILEDVEEDDEEIEVEQCVHFPESLCPPPSQICRCKAMKDYPESAAALCCDISTEYALKEGLGCAGWPNISYLHVRNVTLNALNASVFSGQALRGLAVTDGHITELKSHLDSPNLACLNLSANGLVVEKPDGLSSLPLLYNLDLSRNNLTQLPDLTVRVANFWLDVSGNNKLPCDSIMELMKHHRNTTQKLHFSHEKHTYCLSLSSFHWFNSTEKMPLSSVVLLYKLEQECPHGESERCICKTLRIDMVPGKPPFFSVDVNCSGRRLTELPAELPRNTVSLNVSVNNISDLRALSMNPAYKDIRMFYADDNQITSILALEGSAFIDSFTILSLRGNNISSLPTYILSNVFDRNSNMQQVRLGLNRYKCDCSTAQTVKLWLNANKKHIPDYDEILCDNMPARVFELDKNKVCTVQSDWTDYVYYLVAAEVLLLLLLITKVSYDYWVFKTAGYLPWPASKMPKLPCDWVFES